MTATTVPEDSSPDDKRPVVPTPFHVVVSDTPVDSGTLHALIAESSGSVRVAPLLLVTSSPGEDADNPPEHRIIVGHVVVAVGEDRTVVCELHSEDDWRIRGSHFKSTRDNSTVDAIATFRQQIVPILPKASDDEDIHRTAARYAKAVCELSRDSVIVIRRLRYLLEERLADESATSAGDEHTSVVAAMLKLNIICGRVVDTARTAIREGLFAWITDDDAYHAYRVLRDPSLLIDLQPATPSLRSWMRLHDSAIRQCERLSEQITQESITLVRLLAAASSISSSRDADAQTRLNTLVALLSIGIGVPALVLTMYSTELLLPLQTARQRVAFIPIFLSLFIAAVLAIRLAPKGRARRTWIVAGVAVLIVLAFLVVGAVIIVTHPLVS